MRFPVTFTLGTLRVPAHLLFEILAYAIGFRLYLHDRRQNLESALSPSPLLGLLVGCVFGALVGSKLLAWAESPLEYWAHRSDPWVWLQGKTIVGGLLGGWIGVEIVKRRLRIARSTGDSFVLPLVAGIAIGRAGCFLTGLADRTYGVATSLPWGVDFGDGVRRHPTQLYEILFLAAFGASVRARPPRRSGELFLLFVASYLGFRFAIEYWKPRFHPYLGLSMIQVASLAGIAAASGVFAARRARPLAAAPEASHA